MKSFSFIHTADLHLDSPFIGLRRMDEGVSDLIRDATFRAFDNVVDLALKNRVDFLLVAGDVYDSADRSLRAQLKFASGLKRLADAGIRSFVCHGNHDPLDGWSAALNWPKGVHIFGSQLESVSVNVAGDDRVRVHGISYPHSAIDRSFGEGFNRQGAEPFQIGLFHCSVGSDPAHETYAPRTLEELSAANLDYWALGHVHTHRVLMDGHPFIAYSGSTQGLHIREPGPHGCLLVTVEKHGEIVTSFAPVDAVRWVSGELRADELDTEGDLLEALDRLVDEIRDEAEGRSAIVRASLLGRSPLHRLLHRPQFVEDLTESLREAGLESAPPVWIEQIKVQTSTQVDLDSRRQSPDFLGEVLRRIESSREERTELLEALGELYHDRRGRRFLQIPDEEGLLRLLEEVEAMCLDHLAAEGLE